MSISDGRKMNSTGKVGTEKTDGKEDNFVKSTLQQLMLLLKKRYVGFGLVGIGVMMLGIVVLYVLVRFCRVEQNIAYFIQAVVSIETNFVLNKFVNWRDRKGKLFPQWIKFHTTKIAVVVLNQLLFAVLVYFEIHYLIATVIGVGVAAVVNYFTNDKIVFVGSSQKENTMLE
ncbi:MAG: GtrA family protein [Ktedonobacteraceae bacterium]|nr:GtrA family protein [Ktedonobacteraceae bacterium]